MRIQLKSTAEVRRMPVPARLWVGRTEDGVPVSAYVLLAAGPRSSDKAEVLERTRAALEEHHESTAVITIPLPARPGTPPPEGLVAREWDSYRAGVLDRAAGPVQVLETRRAFYAGAWAFLQLTMALDPGPEPTAADLDMMESIHGELLAFGAGGGEAPR